MKNKKIDLQGLTKEQAFLLGTLCRGFVDGGPDILEPLTGIEIDLGEFILTGDSKRIEYFKKNSIKFSGAGTASII